MDEHDPDFDAREAVNLEGVFPSEKRPPDEGVVMSPFLSRDALTSVLSKEGITKINLDGWWICTNKDCLAFITGTRRVLMRDGNCYVDKKACGRCKLPMLFTPLRILVVSITESVLEDLINGRLSNLFKHPTPTEFRDGEVGTLYMFEEV